MWRNDVQQYSAILIDWPISTVIREVLSSNFCKQMQWPSAICEVQLAEPCWREVGRIVQIRCQGRLPLQSPKNHRINQPGPIGAHRVFTNNLRASVGSTLGLYLYITIVYLSILVVLLTLGAGAVSYSFACFWYHIPHIVLPCLALKQERCLVSQQLYMPCSLGIFGRNEPSWAERED